MSTIRRRVLRSPPAIVIDVQRQHRISRWRKQLTEQQTGLDRWMVRLRRAFHAVEKHQQSIARLQRQLTKLEQG